MKHYIKEKKFCSKWIKPKKEMPIPNVNVLVWKNELDYMPEIAYYDGETFDTNLPRWVYPQSNIIKFENPIAWMPLPNPPYHFINL